MSETDKAIPRKPVQCAVCGGTGRLKLEVENAKLVLVACGHCNGTGTCSAPSCQSCWSTAHGQLHVSGTPEGVAEVMAAVADPGGSGAKKTDLPHRERSGPDQSQHSNLLELRQLEHEYDLARRGMMSGARATVGAFVSVLASLLAAALTLAFTGREFLSGNHLVLIFAILAVGLLVYFSFVFRRAMKLRIEISAKKKELNIESGERV